MSDNNNVIEFKPKNKTQDKTPVSSYFMDMTGEMINTDVIPLHSEEFPNSSREYLALCKKQLEEEDYRDVLCGIMDYEIYNELEEELQDIVDTYYIYEENGVDQHDNL